MHPQKSLIRELWPDKHLYAATLLLVAAAAGTLYTLVVAALPVTYAPDMPQTLRGLGLGLALLAHAIAAALIVYAYRSRSATFGFVAVVIEALTFGALGISTLLAIVSAVFLGFARREGEHTNPATRDLHAHLWPDKALAAALLLGVSAVASIVWGVLLLSGWLSVRGIDTTVWGIIAMVSALAALVGAWAAYRQQWRAMCISTSVLSIVGASFVVVGPALAIAAMMLISRAHREGEFGGR